MGAYLSKLASGPPAAFHYPRSPFLDAFAKIVLARVQDGIAAHGAASPPNLSVSPAWRTSIKLVFAVESKELSQHLWLEWQDLEYEDGKYLAKYVDDFVRGTVAMEDILHRQPPPSDTGSVSEFHCTLSLRHKDVLSEREVAKQNRVHLWAEFGRKLDSKTPKDSGSTAGSGGNERHDYSVVFPAVRQECKNAGHFRAVKDR